MIFATYSISGKCKSIKIMANGTIVIKNLPETWGTDSHISVYMNKFVYSIGGFRYVVFNFHTVILEYFCIKE